jgi:hypothetical protein
MDRFRGHPEITIKTNWVPGDDDGLTLTIVDNTTSISRQPQNHRHWRTLGTFDKFLDGEKKPRLLEVRPGYRGVLDLSVAL